MLIFNKINILLPYLFFFISVSTLSFSMHSPLRVITLFNPETILSQGHSLNSFFNSTLTVTPQEKTVLIGQAGKVYQTDINPFNTTEKQLLFTHPCASDFSSIISADEKKDKTLIIASGYNFFESEKRKWFSEIILYNEENFIVKRMSFPLQGVKLSSNGTLLTAASLDAILLFNLIKSTKDTISFGNSNRFLPEIMHNKVIQLDAYNDVHIVAAGRPPIVSLINIYQEDTELRTSKKITLTEKINDITCASPTTILYSTNQQTKTINIFALLETNDTPCPTNIFSHSKTHEQINLDQNHQIATAHWTKNITLSTEERSTIYIYKSTVQPKSHVFSDDNNAGTPKQFILTAVFNKPTYIKQTKTGAYKEVPSHFITVTLYGSTVAALATTGELFVWRLTSQHNKKTPPISPRNQPSHHQRSNSCNDWAVPQEFPRKSKEHKLSRTSATTTSDSPRSASCEGHISILSHKSEELPRTYAITKRITSSRRNSPRSSSNYNSPRGSSHSSSDPTGGK